MSQVKWGRSQNMEGSHSDTNSEEVWSNKVSCLSVASKVMEKIVCNQVMRFFEVHKLLPDNQHGFRAKRSTMIALSAMQQDWINNWSCCGNYQQHMTHCALNCCVKNWRSTGSTKWHGEEPMCENWKNNLKTKEFCVRSTSGRDPIPNNLHNIRGLIGRMD